MKKFLAILLIAIVACSTEQKLPEIAKSGLSALLKAFKKVVQLLKDIGLWDPAVKFLKEAGLVVPKELCLKVFDEELCGELAGSPLKKYEDGEVALRFPIWVVIDGIITLIDVACQLWCPK